MLSRRTLVVVVGLASLTSACRLFRPVDPSGASAPSPAAAESAPAEQARPAEAPAEAAPARPPIDLGSVTDANVVAMLLASNYTDISYAQLVPARAERTDIKEFARRMLTDHSSLNARVRDLLAKLDLTPEDNVASLDMRDESSEKRDVLRELSGYAFDSTYIENEVSYHRKFLASVDGIMLPRARNAELRQLLESLRPALAAHLAHAEQVRANVLSKK